MTLRYRILITCSALCLAACSADVPPRGPETLANAESLYWRSEFDSARTLWNDALARAQSEHDTATEANSLTWLGLLAWRTGELTEARRLSERALALKQQIHLTDELWRSYNALAVLALSEDRLADALEHAEQAVAAAHAAGNADAELRANMNRALAHSYLGEYSRAREEFQTSYQAARRAGDVRVQANALANLAMVQIAAGSISDAISQLDSARVLYRQIDYSPGEQNALGQLATAYEATGNYGRAILVLDSALALARAHELREQELETLRLLGAVYERAGDVPRALSYLEQARTLGVRLGLPGETGSILRSEARARLSLRMTGRAQALADSARVAHREADEPFEELDDLILLAEIHLQRASRAAARSALDEARRIATSLESRAALQTITLAEARSAEQNGQPAAVLKLIREGPLTGDPIVESEANSLAARAFAVLAMHDSAIAAGYRAVRALDLIRGDLPDALAARYLDSRVHVYGELALALLQKGRASDAFQVADGARSKGLVENLVQAREQLAKSGREESSLQREELLRRIDELVRKLSTLERTPQPERGAAHAEAAQQLTQRLMQARSDYERLVLSGAGHTLPGAGATLHSVQRLLEPTEVLLEYFLTGDGALLFIVTGDAVRTVHLRGTEKLLPRLRVLRDTWGRPGPEWRAGLPFAQALYASLLAPALNDGARAPRRTLIIVPHGVLSQVPFAALVSPESGRFVAQDYATVVLPSAAALVSIRRRAQDHNLARGSAFAPFPRDLPASMAEAAAVSTSAGARVFEARDASEATVRAQLQRARFVHVASHGILNAPNPMFSRIELARRANAGSTDDGRLEVHEVTGLTIRSRLIFLSGCETGAAREWTEDPVRGAAYMTLAQAFLFAGARAVVATLWPISDQGAADFARDFYAAMRGMPTAPALASAQRLAISDPERANPYYWAGYVLHGDGADHVLAQNRAVASVIKESSRKTPVSRSRSNR